MLKEGKWYELECFKCGQKSSVHIKHYTESINCNCGGRNRIIKSKTVEKEQPDIIEIDVNLKEMFLDSLKISLPIFLVILSVCNAILSSTTFSLCFSLFSTLWFIGVALLNVLHNKKELIKKC